MKITKFLALAFASLAIVSCSRSIDNENPKGGEEINSPTYATFKFNIGTKAAADFDPATTPDQDEADKKIGRIQLLIFNAATQALEFNDIVTGSNSKTVLLTAGRKKMFFITNSDKLTTYNTAIDPTTFKIGGANSTLTDFYAHQFSAGTPQKIGETEDRTFNFAPLYTASSALAGLPMSNTNEITYTLTAGVSEADAKTGLAATTGASTTNTFNIQLYYMTAKANLVLGASVLNPTGAGNKPVIKEVYFSIRNLARKTNYIQNVPNAGNPQSAYFEFKGTTQTAFDTEFDYASNIMVSVTDIESKYLYVPENNNAQLQRGQSSYFAIKATYEPTVNAEVRYDVTTKVIYTSKALASTGSKDYIYTTADVQGIPAGTYYSNVDVFAQDAWIRLSGKEYIAATDKTEADALITAAGDPYQSFIDATSYYRVDIGEGSGSETKYGVLRSKMYNATINKITGPGVPSEGDLIVYPENPVSAKTYIDATIVAAEWTTVTQSTDL